MSGPCWHRWLWEPCPWRKDAFLVRCASCRTVSYLATMRVSGPRVYFTHEPYREPSGQEEEA